ncbi:MAG: metallophosphoesterase [Syntrophobacteraceae bacterium]|jgi:hypothetical protein
MKRRDFLKYGSTGVAGLALGGLTRTPLFRIGNIFAGSATAWKFGVMGDTQWTLHPGNSSTETSAEDPSGLNPNSVSVSIIDQVDAQFVDLGVKFVIQVGDLTDCGTTAGIVTRALAAQTNLYPNNIGFFPIRGNHETYGGEYGPLNSYAIPDIQANFPQTRGQGTTWDAINFNSPTKVSTDLDGISYSFDFGPSGNNVRFLMLDTWATQQSNPASAANPTGIVNADGYPYGYTVTQQQAWINQRLNRATRGTEHAFVFTHQPIMAESHQDTIFNGYTNANPAWQNAYYQSLMKNGVRYCIAGHDHMHQRSIIASPDGKSQLEELICASCSCKFYTPTALIDPNWFGQKYRETSISQELATVGFYIFTVDGPLVTVDFYSDDNGQWGSNSNYPSGPSGAGSLITPTFNFIKKETWGYSLSGAEYLVNDLSGITTTTIKFGGTTAHLAKSSIAMDATDRYFTKAVDAYWANKPSGVGAVSNVLYLLGVMDTGPVLGGPPADTFALIMSYQSSANGRSGVSFTLSTTNAGGNWVNAVNENIGGAGNFIAGPCDTSYPLGTYGFDATSKTAWAILNYNGDFAVIQAGS